MDYSEEETEMDRLRVVLDRLNRQLRDIKEGQLSARDDLAVSLHLLIGKGRGYGLVDRAFSGHGIPSPRIIAWNDPKIRTSIPSAKGSGVSSKPMVLGIRSTCPRGSQEGSAAPISDFLKQECLRYSANRDGDAELFSWSLLFAMSGTNMADT
jgi:hypothetical protein